MPNSRALWLTAIVLGGLALISAGQKKPAITPPIQPTAPAQQPQGKRPPQLAVEQNKAPVRQLFEEMVNGGRYDLEPQVFEPNCIVHFGNRALPLREAMAEGKGWKSAAPDMRMQIEQLTVNGDRVTVFWSARGTHTGEGLGTKPTRKQANIRDRSEFLIKNGKIVEAFNSEYRPELFRQLGVSKTAAFMFFAGEEALAVLNPIIPDRVYDWLK